MAVSKKSLNEEIKARYYDVVAAVFASNDLEVLKVGSVEMAIPVLDKNGDEEWLVVTLKVPTGGGFLCLFYSVVLRHSVAIVSLTVTTTTKEAAEKKAAKIAKDKAAREAKKAQREQAEENLSTSGSQSTPYFYTILVRRYTSNFLFLSNFSHLFPEKIT